MRTGALGAVREHLERHPAVHDDFAGAEHTIDHRQARHGGPIRKLRLSPLNRPQLVEEIHSADSRSLRAYTFGDELASLEARLATPLAAPDIADAGRRLKTLNDEIERLEERWLALSDQLEALAGA